MPATKTFAARIMVHPLEACGSLVNSMLVRKTEERNENQ
jgi:hypothetical protein